MLIKNRIKELRNVRAGDLIPNKKNWRTHPIAQREALEGVLETIGYADALIARETPDGLILVDGHLRAETTPDAEVPVLVLDINEREADMLLATLDPLAGMAGRDELKLKDLLQTIDTESEAVLGLLSSLAGDFEPMVDTDNWEEHWDGMPEFDNEDLRPVRTLNVHFRSEEDAYKFAELVGQTITDKTKSIWHPILEKNTYQDDQYIDEEEV